MQTPPGWYFDGQNPHIVRWWDGIRWTEHTQPRMVSQAPPAPVQVVRPPIAHEQQQPIAPPVAQPAVQPAAQAVELPVEQPEVENVKPAVQSVVAEVPIERQLSDAELRLQQLQRELQAVEEAIEIQSFGFYQPKYGFESSALYLDRLSAIKEEQKLLIASERATQCNTVWRVGGSEAQGRKMVARLAKLMLRAFNGECDAAIAKVRYDNVEKFEQRIEKSWNDVNKLGSSNDVVITKSYFELKIQELHLVHEHREKVQEERETQRQIREQLKEEEKARREVEKAQAEAELEEQRHQSALEKARADMAAAEATSKQHQKLEALVNKLELELADAIDRKAKAVARAQLTKSGHVYVLSNIGSFGEGIYKIGLTRRLDPQERIDELGDASVPFGFDVHAVIYSPDAPTLEHVLHREFANRRVNRVNHRKEYFRVSLDEIRAAVEKHHGLVTFVLSPEAEEWRKTCAAMTAGVDSGSHLIQAADTMSVGAGQ